MMCTCENPFKYQKIGVSNADALRLDWNPLLS